MHIYAFGSICRGEVTLGSDVDLLACTDNTTHDFDAEIYSIYSYDRLKSLWLEGNPFAWHLSKESRLIFSSDGADFLKNLGVPESYTKVRSDCEKFYLLFSKSRKALETNNKSVIFNLSSIFLSIRNISTCYALGKRKSIFSRRSAYLIDTPINIPIDVYSTLERARILATRGYGEIISQAESNLVINYLERIDEWMQVLMDKVEK